MPYKELGAALTASSRRQRTGGDDYFGNLKKASDIQYTQDKNRREQEIHNQNLLQEIYKTGEAERKFKKGSLREQVDHKMAYANQLIDSIGSLHEQVEIATQEDKKDVDDLKNAYGGIITKAMDLDGLSILPFGDPVKGGTIRIITGGSPVGVKALTFASGSGGRGSVLQNQTSRDYTSAKFPGLGNQVKSIIRKTINDYDENVNIDPKLLEGIEFDSFGVEMNDSQKAIVLLGLRENGNRPITLGVGILNEGEGVMGVVASKHGNKIRIGPATRDAASLEIAVSSANHGMKNLLSALKLSTLTSDYLQARSKENENVQYEPSRDEQNAHALAIENHKKLMTDMANLYNGGRTQLSKLVNELRHDINRLGADKDDIQNDYFELLDGIIGRASEENGYISEKAFVDHYAYDGVKKPTTAKELADVESVRSKAAVGLGGSGEQDVLTKRQRDKVADMARTFYEETTFLSGKPEDQGFIASMATQGDVFVMPSEYDEFFNFLKINYDKYIANATNRPAYKLYLKKAIMDFRNEIDESYIDENIEN